ncbi:MAG: hypothetical protein KGI58_03485 [Patescibacteria group bacterium]|nr:hypothetical protein [Patescibacteria group bacterium]
MSFSIFPVAEANVVSLVRSVERVVINPIIFFLFAVAMAYFLYGLAQYLLSPDNEEVHKKSKSHMLWGIIGLFIMVSVFGIMQMILNTFGDTNIQLNGNGDYNINYGANSTNNNATLKDIPIAPLPSSGKDVITNSNSTTDTNAIDFGATPPSTKIDSYTTSPFTKKYISNPLCWRKEIYATGSTEYKSLQAIKVTARDMFITENNLIDKNTDPSLPTPYGVLTAYDPATKTHYVWWDARAPINGGTVSDCNLVEASSPDALPQPTTESTTTNPFTTQYASDAQFYRVVDSGVDKTYIGARGNAINNALIQIARLKNLGSTAGIKYTILEEKYYPQDTTTGNFDYWVAIESAK